eukprot:COSAG01_NODE_5335_length_4326_cov_9.032174_1_plen_101_part_00
MPPHVLICCCICCIIYAIWMVVAPLIARSYLRIYPCRMGWSSWNVFAGGIDEQKILSTIDAMAGLTSAGYQYVNVSAPPLHFTRHFCVITEASYEHATAR